MYSNAALEGKHVVVIGGGSGIGRAIARSAKTLGANVTILGRNTGAIDGMTTRRIDLTEQASITAAFADMAVIDHFVITAGARIGSPKLPGMDLDEMRLAFDTKLFGTLAAIQAALPRLSPTASITLTSGLLSRKFGAGGLIKSTVNAAIEATAKNLAKELAPLRVNVVSPGVIDTELWGPEGDATRAATMQRIGSSLPTGRVGQASEVAQAYLFAMTNGFVTGAVIDIEGGGLL